MSLGVLVGAIILAITITVASALLAVAVILAVIALRQKRERKCGAFDLNATVSMDKYSMRILVYCTVNVYAVWRLFIVIYKN